MTMQTHCHMCGGSGWAYTNQNRVAACLCDLGRRKLKIAAGIETIMGEAELLTKYGSLPSSTYSLARECLQRAGVPPEWQDRTLASFRERFKADPLSEKYANYADLWLAAPKRSDLVLYGPNGTGKSGLAIAILHAIVTARQEAARWLSVPRLMLDWRDTFGEAPARTERQLLDELLTPAVLVLDDVTAAKSSEFVESMLTMLVDERQKQGRASIITMNTPSDDTQNDAAVLAAFFGPTLFDRLKERAQFWPMRGQSKRRLWKPPAGKS